MRTQVLGVVLATLALPFAGCGGGGGGGGPTGGTGTSSRPTRSVVTQQGWQLEREQFWGVDIVITTSGSGSNTATADAVVDWTFATDDVDIYVAQTSCSAEMFSELACSFVTKAEGTVKPERVTWTVTGAANYRIFVLNWGPARESGTIEVGLTQ